MSLTRTTLELVIENNRVVGMQIKEPAPQTIIIDDEPHVRLKTHPVERVKKSLNETFEHMKVRLTKEFPDWPNPAVFLARMSYTFPLREAALPVAKKRLMQALQN